MLRKVLAELKSRNVGVEALEKALALLVDGKLPGRDPAWKSLYFQACELRRRQRLKVFDRHSREFVYAKHFVFGDCQAMFAMTDHLTDAVFRECGLDYRTNSQLCKLTISADGTVATETILDCPEGVVRDPCASHDGRKLVFSMRRTSHDGDEVWLHVEFGREVETERVVLVSHQQDGQAKTWTGATLEFSSGEKVPICVVRILGLWYYSSRHSLSGIHTYDSATHRPTTAGDSRRQ